MNKNSLEKTTYHPIQPNTGSIEDLKPSCVSVAHTNINMFRLTVTLIKESFKPSKLIGIEWTERINCCGVSHLRLFTRRVSEIPTTKLRIWHLPSFECLSLGKLGR